MGFLSYLLIVMSVEMHMNDVETCCAVFYEKLCFGRGSGHDLVMSEKKNIVPVLYFTVQLRENIAIAQDKGL